MSLNLYVHFPFCASKCAYCALHSRAGASLEEMSAYSRRIAGEIAGLQPSGVQLFSTVYFGGGTPSMCPLGPVLEAVSTRLKPGAEFTVELNPADVCPELLFTLASHGVNRLSMGVQSFDDTVLGSMGRRHSSKVAVEAFRMCREAGFANVGIDLIAGYPGGGASWRRTLEIASSLKPDHASVYTLILEEGTPLCRAALDGRTAIPSDDDSLSELYAARDALAEIGLERYEISNFARRGFECRHNCAVWAGEDYIGIGEGAKGRMGLNRTDGGKVVETLSPESDALERAIFSLRTRSGLDLARIARRWPVLAPRLGAWREALVRAGKCGLVKTAISGAWTLTERGAETCDSLLEELM